MFEDIRVFSFFWEVKFFSLSPSPFPEKTFKKYQKCDNVGL
jgi:hypothetical protein